MTSLAVSRIKREFKEVVRSEEISQCSIKLELFNNSWTQLRGEIGGPPDTPYEGGTFKLEINVPDSYPFSPPKVRFITHIWHPNISSATGAICLDILKDNWAAAMTLRTVLLSLQALMGAAEPDDPQDAMVGRQFKNHHEIYIMTARHWTNVYAGGPYACAECELKIQQLKDMGAEEQNARTALSHENWNLKRASDVLFSDMA